MLTFARSAASTAAPAIAGSLIATIGLAGVLWTDFTTFLFAAATLMLVRIPRPETSSSEDAGPASENRDLAYPHGGSEVTEQQLDAYPDLAPIELAVVADEAYERALAAAEELGLEILYEDPTGSHFEATDTSRLFRFVDDFVVEVESGDGGSGSVVHVRSTSRVGQSDLGANTERIRRFTSRLKP